MAKTKIEWADNVWNPVTGCTKVSEGCRHCYAERYWNRFHQEQKFSEIQYHPKRLEQPLHWKKPARIFVDSMGDLFHPQVSNAFLSEIFWIMEMAPNHIFIILTKRPLRMNRWMSQEPDRALPNVWLGVSVEDQKAADMRVPWLLKTPAMVRFVSVEPMLGSIDIKNYLWPVYWRWDGKFSSPEEALAAGAYAEQKPQGLVSADSNFLDWVICGGETGPGARPMDLDWARYLRDQCQAAEVPFFLKQTMINGKLIKMPELDEKVWTEMPERVG